MREFGELESAIMDVVWASDRAYLVREVRERLSYNRSLAYTTVMTVMNILYGKGVLCREKHGRAWRYWPAESREEHDARLMAEVLHSGGNEHITMMRFVERVSDEERESLRSAAPSRRGSAASRHPSSARSSASAASCQRSSSPSSAASPS